MDDKKTEITNKIGQNKTEENEKTQGNNQWTTNNSKYYPDLRERRDGPGGEDEK